MCQLDFEEPGRCAKMQQLDRYKVVASCNEDKGENQLEAIWFYARVPLCICRFGEDVRGCQEGDCSVAR